MWQPKETKRLLSVRELLTFGDADVWSKGLKESNLGFGVLVPSTV